MSKKIQKRRTEQEMRMALAHFCDGNPERCIPPQVDDSDIILNDAIEELLELRQEREDVRAFVQTMHAKMNRR
jgi:hypothetical protein